MGQQFHLKAGMSDRAPFRFPHLSFIRLEPYPARFARHLPHAGKALMRGRRWSRFAVFPMGKAVLSFSALETHFTTLFHTASALSAPSGHFSHWKGKENSRSFEPTCVSNECAFAGSWRDVPYKYAALRVLMQCTTSLKVGMSDRAPLRFPHLSFIRLEPYPARFARHLPHAGKAFRFFPEPSS